MRNLLDRVNVALGRGLTLSREDLRREDGQGAVEYALVVLGVAAIIAAAVAGFTTQIKNFMTGAGTALQGFIP